MILLWIHSLLTITLVVLIFLTLAQRRHVDNDVMRCRGRTAAESKHCAHRRRLELKFYNILRQSHGGSADLHITLPTPATARLHASLRLTSARLEIPPFVQARLWIAE